MGRRMERVLVLCTVIIGVISLITDTLVLGLVAFQLMEKYSEKRPTPAPASIEKDAEEIAQQKQLKKKLDDEQAAFDELMGYSAAQAYGLHTKE